MTETQWRRKFSLLGRVLAHVKGISKGVCQHAQIPTCWDMCELKSHKSEQRSNTTGKYLYASRAVWSTVHTLSWSGGINNPPHGMHLARETMGGRVKVYRECERVTGSKAQTNILRLDTNVDALQSSPSCLGPAHSPRGVMRNGLLTRLLMLPLVWQAGNTTQWAFLTGVHNFW